MRFQVNDIVASAPGWRSAVFVITGIEPHRPKNPYNGVSLVNGKTYRLSDESLANKRVGVADAGWNKVSLPDGDSSVSVDQNFAKGLTRAQRELMVCTAADRSRWEKLLKLKPGDTFRINLRGKIENMKFRYVTERGYKFVFVADNESGTRYKYPLSVVIPD